MSQLTLADVQPLLDNYQGAGQILSCYADLKGAAGFDRPWRAHLATEADGIRELIGGNAVRRQEFEQNLAAIDTALASPPEPKTRWLAVFSARQRGILKVVPLEIPVQQELVIDKSPYLVPLLSVIHRQRHFLAVHTDTHRGRLYVATPGSVRLLDEIDWDVSKKQHSSGEMWGQSQATIARHREDAIAHYQKELSHRIEVAWAQNRFGGLILLGSHATLEHVRKALPRRLSSRVEREIPESWYERPSDVADVIQEAARGEFDADEKQAVEALWDRLAVGRGVATGAEHVLAAIETGQVGPGGAGYLVFGPDPREVVGKCTGCRALSVDVPDQCPRCQASCVEASLWEELLLLALRHGIVAHFVDDAKKLAAHCGLVAVLRRTNASASDLTGITQAINTR